MSLVNQFKSRITDVLRSIWKVYDFKHPRLQEDKIITNFNFFYCHKFKEPAIGFDYDSLEEIYFSGQHPSFHIILNEVEDCLGAQFPARWLDEDFLSELIKGKNLFLERELAKTEQRRLNKLKREQESREEKDLNIQITSSLSPENLKIFNRFLAKTKNSFY